jgi:hypothetical protein
VSGRNFLSIVNKADRRRASVKTKKKKEDDDDDDEDEVFRLVSFVAVVVPSAFFLHRCECTDIPASEPQE